MKKVALFCIPAHGHTNPMLPVAAELVRRGNTVRFYSFNEFKSKIEATGAAEFIENAPHSSNGIDLSKELSKANGKFQCLYWGIAMAIIILVGVFIGWKYVWIVGIPVGILSTPIGKALQKRQYKLLIEKMSR